MVLRFILRPEVNGEIFRRTDKTRLIPATGKFAQAFGIHSLKGILNTPALKLLLVPLALVPPEEVGAGLFRQRDADVIAADIGPDFITEKSTRLDVLVGVAS